MAQRAKTILVADDEALILNLTERLLSRRGFDVLTATNGLEAVEIYRSNTDEIDAVILDLTMPILDGEQALAAIRKVRPDARVILTSGYADPGVTDPLTGEPAAGFLAKPYVMSTLVSTLESVIARAPAHA